MSSGRAPLLCVLVFIARAADLKPPEFANVTGQVVNAITGEPLAEVQLTLSATTASDVSYHATSDEVGRFSLNTVPPGAYELVIQKPDYVQAGRSFTLAAGQAGIYTSFRLMPQAVIAGRVVDADGGPIRGAMVHAIQSRYTGEIRQYFVSGTSVTNDLGEYRIFGLPPGQYYLGGAARGRTGYYPGTQQVSQAVAIEAVAGGEVPGVNLTLPEMRAVRVRGTIQSAGDLPVQGMTVIAVPCDSGPLNRATASIRNADGLFELRDLAPGCYILAADSFRGGRRYSARFSLNVADADIEGVRLNLLPPTQVTGRVKIDGGGDLRPEQLVINLASRLSKVTASGAPSEDGHLVLHNVVPENYELTVLTPDGYFLKSARFGTTDVLESGLDLRNGALGMLELEISSAGGSMDGSVTDVNEQRLPGARVVMIPQDGRGRPPRFKIAATDQKGSFSLRGIAPGEYRIYAFQSVDVGALQDPSYILRFQAQGKRVSVSEHGQELIQLKAILTESDRLAGK